MFNLQESIESFTEATLSVSIDQQMEVEEVPMRDNGDALVPNPLPSVFQEVLDLTLGLTDQVTPSYIFWTKKKTCEVCLSFA